MGDVNEGVPVIPQDLLAEIFCRLPVKSLLRFTCVCKAWLSLIRDDHHFAIKHYLARTTSSSYVLDSVDYMLDDTSLYYITAAKTFKYLKRFDTVPADIPIGISNSCHGIICVTLWTRSQIFLFNPSIREVVPLPPCPNEGYAVLGFDVINNDYKVAVISCESFCTVNVYSVRQGYWRSLHFSDSPQCIYRFEGCDASNANGRLCNTLFCKKPESTVHEKGLLSFDMVEEVLKELPVPECGIRKEHEHRLLSSSRWQACLSCLPLYWDYYSKYVDIWVLKHSEDWVWSKVFAVKCPGPERMRPTNLWLNDKELFVNVEDREFTQKVFLYDIDAQQLRRTGRNGSLDSLARGYAESLVSIKHLTSPIHECKHGEGDKQSEDSKLDDDDDDGGLIFREVSRKGVRWSHRFKPM